MKNIDPKRFWGVFVVIIMIVTALIVIVSTLLIVLIFWACAIFGTVILYPFLPHIPAVQNFSLYLFEMECNVLKVLRMARFDPKIKFGWMREKEIVKEIEGMFDCERNHLHWCLSVLIKLKREGVVLHEEVTCWVFKKSTEREWVCYGIQTRK